MGIVAARHPPEGRRFVGADTGNAVKGIPRAAGKDARRVPLVLDPAERAWGGTGHGGLGFGRGLCRVSSGRHAVSAHPVPARRGQFGRGLGSACLKGRRTSKLCFRVRGSWRSCLGLAANTFVIHKCRVALASHRFE